MFLPQATKTPGISEIESAWSLWGLMNTQTIFKSRWRICFQPLKGVGKVKVLVYVDESCELVPAYDSEKNESNLEEQDSEEARGSRMITGRERMSLTTTHCGS